MAAGLTHGALERLNIKPTDFDFGSGAIRASTQNIAAQGINRLAGRQDSFSWRAVASSALAGGFSSDFSSDNQAAAGTVGLITDRLVFGSNDPRGVIGGFDVLGVAATALGGAIWGSMLQARNERLAVVYPGSPHGGEVVLDDGFRSPGSPHSGFGAERPSVVAYPLLESEPLGPMTAIDPYEGYTSEQLRDTDEYKQAHLKHLEQEGIKELNAAYKGGKALLEQLDRFYISDHCCPVK